MRSLAVFLARPLLLRLRRPSAWTTGRAGAHLDRRPHRPLQPAHNKVVDSTAKEAGRAWQSA